MPEIKVETGKATAPPPKKDTRPRAPIAVKGITAERTDAIDGVFQLAGMGLVMAGQYADAGAIDMHGHGVSLELAELAGKNEGIAKAVDSLLQVGPYAGLVVAMMPLVMQVLANHKVIAADKMPPSSGVVKPESLEAQVKAAMAKQALEALHAQKEAEEELARMQAEFAASQNGSEPSE
jgi:hypothetical protein